MTEALRRIGPALPRAVAPGRTLPHLPAAADVRPAAREAAVKAAAEVRRPYHVGTLLGVSACVYAGSLAGVAWLQGSSDAATAAAQAPAMTAVDAMAADADRLERTIAGIRERLGAAGDGYGAAPATIAALEARLDALAATVAEVEAASLQLPTRIAVPTRSRATLPTVSRPAAATKPRTVATTGASGG